MPTDDRFLEAVIADPASDGPRLIYADWLEETGREARAEFIRVQCALGKIPRRDRPQHPLAGRETELWRAHRLAWREPLDRALFPDGDADTVGAIQSLTEIVGNVLSFGRFNFAAEFVRRLLAERWEYYRGFAEKLHAVESAYVAGAERVHRVTPLRSLNLTLDRDGELESLANCKSTATLESLKLFGRNASARGFDRFLAGRHFGSLKRLVVSELSIADDEIERFSESSLLASLDELELASIGMGPSGISALVASEPFARLFMLGLRSCRDGIDWPATIAAWPRCDRMQRLDLSGNSLGDADLVALLDRFPALEVLVMNETGMTEFGLRGLLRSPRLRQLRRLELMANRISDAGAIDLADSPNLLATTKVVLTGNPIGERVREALRIRLSDQVLF